MSLKFSFFKTLFFFLFRILFGQFRNPKSLHRSVSNINATHSKYQKYTSLDHKSDLSTKTLVFDVEGALMKSSSLFPYFMLVAFEAGGLIRAFVLLLSYPFICLVGEEMGLKIMVMVCFFGIKKDNFRVGTAVLPKFFLENVGLEIFQVLKRGGKSVGVSNMPQVMIDSFLRDYLEIDVVVGRYLKVFCGHFVGLMEERNSDKLVLEDILGQENNVVGISPFNNSLDHKTLLDPLYLCFALKENLTAVTYSLSRMSEILSPIKTVRLTRNRDQDGKMMERLLNQGDLVVCPEGTTCREPYLLRFSPLFAELSDNIVPVANNTHVTMFHGTTAGGLKCLDPLLFLMNPSPSYTVELLDGVSGLYTCPADAEKSRFDVANNVQSKLGKALGFECTKLTRRDKYMILAGNEGIACTSKKS
ncbi:hypothetical protein JRO89_XS01G0355700 [Xanthoceras sorbifolium]|uniref:Phospholipid/glycerol acyltransferase domain-containing protein n=1 Tax=Xanthoceras sorbifolium TaxID=99658 RepID=A0ABQ8IND7_9ROSI|nr:hypothetical protein JRO89_XS01G0355700 [Xanthoceras sorbifolium]